MRNKNKKGVTQMRISPLGGTSEMLQLMMNKGETDYGTLLTELLRQADLLKNNDMSHVESMLLAQANGLQAMFLKTSKKMASAENLYQLQAWANIALKAQNQCRQTLSTLADIKNPHRATLFIKQQNNAMNQQVNDQAQVNFEKKIRKCAKRTIKGDCSCESGQRENELSNLY